MISFICAAHASPETGPYHTSVTLHAGRMPLREILKDISDQTRLCFVYEDALVHQKYASYSVTGVPAESILRRIAADNGLSFRVYSNQIVVFYKKPPKRAIPENEDDTPLMYIPPMQTHKLPINYPYLAQLKGHQGIVQVLVSIDSQGHVIDASIEESSGSTILDQAAVQHVQTLNFKPATINREPVRSLMKLTFEFRLIDQDTDIAGTRTIRAIPGNALPEDK